MPINKEKLGRKVGTRFYIFGTDAKSKFPEWIEVRLLSAKDYEEIFNATQRRVRDFYQPRKANGKLDRRAQVQIVETTEYIDDNAEALERKMRIERSIVGWQLYEETDNGELVPFPYTPENVEFLLENDPSFVQAWGEAIEKLADVEVRKAEEEKKTSKSSRKSSSKK